MEKLEQGVYKCVGATEVQWLDIGYSLCKNKSEGSKEGTGSSSNIILMKKYTTGT